MPAGETNSDSAATLALDALAWILATPERAERFLNITGIAPDTLRTRADDPVVLAAALGFLEAHEPDLIACAEALDVPPAALVQARQRLETA